MIEELIARMAALLESLQAPCGLPLLRYARLLTEAISLDHVPDPLAALLTAV